MQLAIINRLSYVFQDTVVALQALSDFAAMAYSDSFDIQATITADTFTHTFTINKQNALVLQSVVVCICTNY